MSNNAAQRALRCVAVGRRNRTFAGSDEGGRRAATIYTLIETAKLNDIDPRAWLADVLARLPDHQPGGIGELLPWNWRTDRAILAASRDDAYVRGEPTNCEEPVGCRQWDGRHSGSGVKM